MNTQIKATNITVTPDISNYAEKRFEAITKFFTNDPSAKMDVELGRTTAHHKAGDIFKAEIHIVGKGLDLYANSEEENIYKAIDSVRDEILREVRSSKAKKISLVRRSGLMVKNLIKGFWPDKNNNV